MRLLILFGLARVICHGCSCVASPVPIPTCQFAWQYHAVFTGIVTGITDRELPVIVPGKPRPEPDLFLKKQVMLKITQVFTGVNSSEKEITIETGFGGGDCGFPFERGVEYIIYAFNQTSGRLSTGICSPTKRTESAAEDLTYFRQLGQAAPVSEIRVTAFDPHKSWGNSTAVTRGIAPLPEARVTIEGPNVRRTATTDGNGRHVFDGLPPGEYKVAVTLDGMMPAGIRPIKVHAKGCAEVAAALRLERIVSGRILTADGQPAAGVKVEAVRTRPRHENELPFSADSATTDPNGRYELRGLTTGDYYLGISLSSSPSLENPYTRWFYPGTEQPTAAITIHVSERSERQSFDLTVPARQNPRVIEGVVVWPDGRPAPDVQLYLEDPRWPWQAPPVVASTDPAGRFKVTALDGTSYRIHAVSLANGSSSAEPLLVKPGATPARLSLALTHKGHSAAEQPRKGLDEWRSGKGLW